MASVTFTATYTLKLLDLNVDITAQALRMTVGFADATNTLHGSRTLTIKADLSCIDDTGHAMPNIAASFKNALTGGGANSGLIPEANSYISTNATNFII